MVPRIRQGMGTRGDTRYRLMSGIHGTISVNIETIYTLIHMSYLIQPVLICRDRSGGYTAPCSVNIGTIPSLVIQSTEGLRQTARGREEEAAGMRPTTRGWKVDEERDI